MAEHESGSENAAAAAPTKPGYLSNCVRAFDAPINTKFAPINTKFAPGKQALLPADLARRGRLGVDALKWVARGFAVFPCRPRDKAPEWRLVPKDKDPDGNPIDGTGGFKKATRDTTVICDWWGRVPNANIGVVPGDGFFVLDLDGHDAVSWFINASGRHGEPDKTLTVRTREGRFHLYFYAEWEIACSTSRIAPHVDVKAGTDGYVIGAPSIHPDGHAYKIVRDLPIAEAPRWLVDLALPDEKPAAPGLPAIVPFNGNRKLRAIPGILSLVANAREGERNKITFWAACRFAEMVDDGLITRRYADELLVRGAASSGLSGREILTTGRSAFNRGRR